MFNLEETKSVYIYKSTNIKGFWLIGLKFFNGCVGGLLYQCFGLIVFINWLSAPQEIDEYELVDPVDILIPLEKSGFWDGVVSFLPHFSDCTQ